MDWLEERLGQRRQEQVRGEAPRGLTRSGSQQMQWSPGCPPGAVLICKHVGKRLVEVQSEAVQAASALAFRTSTPLLGRPS